MTANERELASRVLRAMAHPIRLGILDVLRHGPKTVSELFEELGCSQSSMSLQLRTLETSGLVSSYREGTRKYSSLRNRDVLRMMECLRMHLHTYLAGNALGIDLESGETERD